MEVRYMLTPKNPYEIIKFILWGDIGSSFISLIYIVLLPENRKDLYRFAVFRGNVPRIISYLTYRLTRHWLVLSPVITS
jgi:hypothetical protein